MKHVIKFFSNFAMSITKFLNLIQGDNFIAHFFNVLSKSNPPASSCFFIFLYPTRSQSFEIKLFRVSGTNGCAPVQIFKPRKLRKLRFHFVFAKFAQGRNLKIKNVHTRENRICLHIIFVIKLPTDFI